MFCVAENEKARVELVSFFLSAGDEIASDHSFGLETYD